MFKQIYSVNKFVTPLILICIVVVVVTTIQNSSTSFVAPNPGLNVSLSSSSSSSGSAATSSSYVTSSSSDISRYVIVGAGQSNMMGYAPGVDPTYDANVPGVLQYVIGDQYSRSQTYAGFTIAAGEALQDGSGANNIGPLYQLSKQFVLQTDIKNVILIQSGIGSTSSQDWISSHLTRSINAGKALNATISNMKVAMFAWLQGESDSQPNSDPVVYYNNMMTIINRLRTETPGATSSTPFVMVSMVPEEIIFRGDQMVRISNVHRLIPNYVPYTAFRAAPMGMQSGCSPGWDRVHFGATGQRINGFLFLDAYKQALLNTQPFMIPSHPTNVALNGNILSWTNTNGTSYALIYRLYQPCNDANVVKPTILPLTSNPQTISVFTGGQTYQYDVLAYKNGLHSSQDPIWKLTT